MSVTIRDFEDVIEIVSGVATEMILDVVDTLMPDGTPFLHKKAEFEDKLVDYLPLRGDPQAWAQKLLEDGQLITDKLAEAGIDQETINSVHPFDIASKFAILYSAEMEEEIRNHSG